MEINYQKIREHLQNAPNDKRNVNGLISMAGFARLAGTSRQSIYNMQEKHPDIFVQINGNWKVDLNEVMKQFYK